MNTLGQLEHKLIENHVLKQDLTVSNTINIVFWTHKVNQNVFISAKVGSSKHKFNQNYLRLRVALEP